MQEMARDTEHVVALEARLKEGVTSACDHVQLNGPADHARRYPGNVNLSFAYVEGESLLMGLRDIAVRSTLLTPVQILSAICQHAAPKAQRTCARSIALPLSPALWLPKLVRFR